MNSDLKKQMATGSWGHRSSFLQLCTSSMPQILVSVAYATHRSTSDPICTLRADFPGGEADKAVRDCKSVLHISCGVMCQGTPGVQDNVGAC